MPVLLPSPMSQSRPCTSSSSSSWSQRSAAWMVGEGKGYHSSRSAGGNSTQSSNSRSSRIRRRTPALSSTLRTKKKDHNMALQDLPESLKNQKFAWRTEKLTQELVLKLEQYTQKAKDHNYRILRLLDTVRGRSGKRRVKSHERHRQLASLQSPLSTTLVFQKRRIAKTITTHDFRLICQRFGFIVNEAQTLEIFKQKNLRTDGKLTIHQFTRAFLSKDYIAVQQMWANKGQDEELAKKGNQVIGVKKIPSRIHKSKYAWSHDRIASLLRLKLQTMIRQRDQIRMLLRILGHSQDVAHSNRMSDRNSPVAENEARGESVTISISDFQTLCSSLGFIVSMDQAIAIFEDYDLPTDGSLTVYTFARNFLNHYQHVLSHGTSNFYLRPIGYDATEEGKV